MEYNILIVDDEAWHRRGMKNLLNQLYPKFTVYDAKNGKAAIEICQNQKIDIVVTDISMPNIDGLQLIAHLQKNNPIIKIIILTAYNKFEYAKEAIKYGVIDYLIKPVKISELQDVFEKTILELEKDHIKDAQRTQNNIDNIWNRNHLINQWLLNRSFNAEIIFEISQFMEIISRPGSIILFQIVFPNTMSVREQIINYLKTVTSTYLYWLESDHNILIACYMDTPPTFHLLKEIIDYCQINFNQSIRISVGEYVIDMSSQACQSFQSAYSTLPLHFYEKGNPLYSNSPNLLEYITNYNHYYPFEKEVISALQKGNLQDAMENFSSILESFSSSANLNPQSVRHIVVYILHNIINAFHYLLSSEQQQEILEEIDLLLIESNTISQLSNCSQNIIKMVFETITSRRELEKNRLTQIVEYISHHYAENITLNELAYRFSFHPSYLSTLFKSSFGMKYTDYILNLKMNTAKEFLENPLNRISDIAEKLGYSSAGYFSKAFKKFFGMTPEEYRKNYQKEKK